MRELERFSPAQSRAARGFAGWNLEALAQHMGVEAGILHRYETGQAGLAALTAANLAKTFALAGLFAVRIWGAEAVFFTPGREPVAGVGGSEGPPNFAALAPNARREQVAVIQGRLSRVLSTFPDQRGPRGR